MSITATQIKDLREKTGAGMLDAKNALIEAGGDMEKASELLRQKGMATAEKKSGRTAAEGTVASHVAANNKSGILVEVNCETDFVAKGEPFQLLAKEICEQIMTQNPDSVDTLLAQPSLHLSGQTVQGYLTEKIGTIKENINVRRFVRYELAGAGRVHSYIHTGGKIGVLVELTSDNASVESNDTFTGLAKDLAMQIASAAPEFVDRNGISPDVIEAETRVEMGKEDLANKPEDIRKKIVAGRVDKLLAQRVLLEQPFVKDPGKTVSGLLDEVGTQLGAKIGITRFTRYMLGEGIEKKESNFAEEVMAAQRV
jgi:elongation factor Ts